MIQNIINHGENLRLIFSFPRNADMLPICKKLFVLEVKTNRLMVGFCNGLISSDSIEYAVEKTFNTLCIILRLQHSSPIAQALIINRDPRGYALKIASSFCRENSISIYRDIGGYGILAPDFTIYKP